MLTRKSFDTARRFIETTARPLEVARLRYAFEDGTRESVIEALSKYQNADGGFGHALEPDLRAEDSSALCTSVAFQTLRAIGASSDEACVVTGIKYLLETLDSEEGHWRIIPELAAQSPHAPWWQQAGQEAAYNSFSLNPTAEILGYLYDHQSQTPDDILSLVSDRVLSYLAEQEEIEMHDLLCCLRLLQTESLPDEMKDQVYRKLTQLIDGTIAYDPEQWKGYSLQPLQVVDGPESPFMAGREAPVAANLDYEVALQNEDGSWQPTWSWGDAFPDVWPQAGREWSGVLTLDKLLLLRRFNRIEGDE